ncbi:class I SAM-dependent methyltransferase [Microlunatus parietis]|uniref:SAM-dependent methyltransferase n=1 Tax=Microlunatus parietis TaxID=682979 RepID=A0A7Y9I590_9ACTN|nr:class I SAM-dependent methyltransferase [Microlunatus parietis]NYE70520.1 SAM-dependent methyltransferase [Microlunatus parietis]
MSFAVAGDAYDRFMGRYSAELAPLMIDFAAVGFGDRVLDVGCGPGALTARLAERVGAVHVAAVDPSTSFVEACQARVPDAVVRQAGIERLPWPDDTFDAALSQLVINFVPDPVVGMIELTRVVRPGGLIAACTWEYGHGMEMLDAFWRAALSLDPDAPDEAGMPLRTADSLAELWRRAGLDGNATEPLVVTTTYADFEELWQPLTYGIGPAGSYCQTLDPERQAELRAALFVELGAPAGAFSLSARASAVRGRTPSRN